MFCLRYCVRRTAGIEMTFGRHTANTVFRFGIVSKLSPHALNRDNLKLAVKGKLSFKYYSVIH